MVTEITLLFLRGVGTSPGWSRKHNVTQFKFWNINSYNPSPFIITHVNLLQYICYHALQLKKVCSFLVNQGGTLFVKSTLGQETTEISLNVFFMCSRVYLWVTHILKWRMMTVYWCHKSRDNPGPLRFFYGWKQKADALSRSSSLHKWQLQLPVNQERKC